MVRRQRFERRRLAVQISPGCPQLHFRLADQVLHQFALGSRIRGANALLLLRARDELIDHALRGAEQHDGDVDVPLDQRAIRN